MIKPILLFFLFCTFFKGKFALEAIGIPGKLPTVLFSTAAVYDGDDSIYIIGGYNGGYYTTVGDFLRLNLTTHELEKVGQFANNQARRQGSAVYDPVDHKIYYYGGSDYNGNGPRNYWNIDVATFAMTNPSFGMWQWLFYDNAVWDNATNTAYLFGSLNAYDGSQVVAWSKTTQEFTNILPHALSTARKFDYSSVAWDQATRTAYIMGGYSLLDGVSSYKRIYKWTAPNGQLELLDVTLPYDTLYTSAIWDAQSNCAYVIGSGYFAWEGGNNAVIFCPATKHVSPLAIDNLHSVLQFSTSVYIPKLNRIYVVGGHYLEDTSDSILYIDLD